ncbi:EAL domain-containing protein [Undibacterium fentianense]|uniref:EAL domain-containing protein n=1 Tax=Undibacterium fentianense TaxID=2828728 RepID=A0A941IDU8_9BURK|nr:EAL domain-containing protein [Undibacterium fentianense]MBR7800373.1 EAL domain-containing protein [Undibacterium fentianense]
MFGLTRQRFVLLATTMYIVFALAWIFLSDQLLAMFADVSSVVWLSTVKGVFFVVATATLFYFSMHAVPNSETRHKSEYFQISAQSSLLRPHSLWLVYGLTLALTIAMLVLHQTVILRMHGQPMLILFIFPIVLSAMLGGFWPGLLSTSLAAAGIYWLANFPLNGSVKADSTFLLQWMFFVLNGLAVSVLSELLKRSLAKDEQQRHLLDAIVSSTSDAIFVKDLQGRYVLANRAVSQHLEKSLEQVIGAQDSELFHELTATGMSAKDQSIVDNRRIDNYETELTTLAGKTRTFLVTKGPLLDAKGDVCGVFGISHDITERKQIEEDLRLVLQEAGDAIWICDSQERFLFANPSALRLTGHTLQQIQTMHIADLLDERDRAMLPEHLRVLQTERYVRSDWAILRLDGEIVQVDLSTARLPDGRYIAFGRDLTEMHVAQNALREREQQLERVLEGTDQGYWDWNLETNQFEVSARWETMLGYEPGELDMHPDNWSTLVHPKEYAKALDSIQQHLAGKSPLHELELRCKTKNGEWRWILTRGKVVERAQDGTPLRMSGTHTDISTRKQLELAQKDAFTVFSSSYEGIMVVGTNGLISKVNPSFSRITGYTEAEVLGRSPKLLSSGKHSEDFYRHLWMDLSKNDFWCGEIWNRRKSGENYIELLSISTVRDESGAVLHYIGVFSDISLLKEHEAELDKIAHYDTLTGLPNRRLLGDRLSQALIRAERDASLLAVCFLDLDGFKAVNDEFGHHIGDELLIGVTEHLRSVLRANDTLARLGGDEFVILLSDMQSEGECRQILDRVLLAVARTVRIDQIVLHVSASIGVSMYPDDHADADSLLRHADQAMYIAKNAGKNRFHMFDPESDRKAQFHRNYLDTLNLALVNNEFVLYYQPKVDLRDGRLVGAEALLRWVHPERGVLPPGEFLSHIHGSPLDHQLGDWVIRQALAQGERWHQQGLQLSLSVNISADHLIQKNFAERLGLALAQHPGHPAHCFELEVLETAAIADIEHAVLILQECRRLGVHFSLDDFGTGYSSLTYLRKLPIDTLKIDQSFVRDMLQDKDDLEIVESVVRLAHAFHRVVIAEGVETMEHGAVLLELGCYLAQGYGIARPMPAEELLSWSEKWQTERAWLKLNMAKDSAN